MKWTISSRFFLICVSLALVVGLSGQKALAEGDNVQGGNGDETWLQGFANKHYKGNMSAIFAYESFDRDDTRGYVVWMKTPTELR